jgi:hypothetical protein
LDLFMAAEQVLAATGNAAIGMTAHSPLPGRITGNHREWRPPEWCVAGPVMGVA